MTTNQGLFGVPAPVGQTTKVQQARMKTGLVRMAVGSTHLLKIVGVEKGVYCTARDHRDVSLEKAVYFCQHERCAGKTWATVDELRRAHPERALMERQNEVHVYGLFSNELFDSAALAEAKTALEKAKKAHERLIAKTPDDEPAIEKSEKRLRDAKDEVQRGECVVGLIAPPDDGVD